MSGRNAAGQRPQQGGDPLPWRFTSSLPGGVEGVKVTIGPHAREWQAQRSQQGDTGPLDLHFTPGQPLYQPIERPKGPQPPQHLADRATADLARALPKDLVWQRTARDRLGMWPVYPQADFDSQVTNAFTFGVANRVPAVFDVISNRWNSLTKNDVEFAPRTVWRLSRQDQRDADERYYQDHPAASIAANVIGSLQPATDLERAIGWALDEVPRVAKSVPIIAKYARQAAEYPAAIASTIGGGIHGYMDAKPGEGRDGAFWGAVTGFGGDQLVGKFVKSGGKALHDIEDNAGGYLTSKLRDLGTWAEKHEKPVSAVASGLVGAVADHIPWDGVKTWLTQAAPRAPKPQAALQPTPPVAPRQQAPRRPVMSAGSHPQATRQLVQQMGMHQPVQQQAVPRQQAVPQAAPYPHLDYDLRNFGTEDGLSSVPDPHMAQTPAASVPDQGGIVYHPHSYSFLPDTQGLAAGAYASPGYGVSQPGQSAAPAYQIGPFFDANGMPIDQSRQTGPFSFAVPTADQGTADFYAQLGNLRRDADAMAVGPYPNPGDAARAAQLLDPRPVYPTNHPYGFGAGFAPDQVASGRPYAVAPQAAAVPADDQGTIVYRTQPPIFHRYGAQPGVGLYGDAGGDPHYGLSYDDGAGGYAQDGSDGFDFLSPASVHAGGWQHPADALGQGSGLLVAAPGARFSYGSAAPAPVIGGIIPLGLGAAPRSEGSGGGSGSVPLYSSYTGYGGAGAVEAQPAVAPVADPSGWSPRSAVRNILAIAPDDGQGLPNWLDPNTPPPQIMLNIPDLSGLIR